MQADPVIAEQTSANSEGIVGLDEPKKMTREDWRKKKELEEQRKLGNAPAEVDEEGKWVHVCSVGAGSLWNGLNFILLFL